MQYFAPLALIFVSCFVLAADVLLSSRQVMVRKPSYTTHLALSILTVSGMIGVAMWCLD